MRFIQGLCLISLAITWSISPADMCKWVDENGVVHYAETCPEGIEGASVKTQPGPSPAEVAAAQERSQAMQQQRAAARESDQAAQQARADQAQSRQGREELAAVCEHSFREVDLLKFDMPVYRDSGGRLHHQESLHHHFYDGPRSYIDDEDRAAELAALEAQIARECDNVRPARSSYVYRFIGKPNAVETLRLLEDMNLPGGPPMEEACTYARLTAQDLRKEKPGIPSDDQRELDRLLNEHCH